MVDTSSSNIPNSPSSSSAAANAGDPKTPAVSRRSINGGGGAELTSFTTGKKNKAPNSTSGSSVVSEVISGYVQGEFPCVWQNYNGRLIAGSRAVIFHGSFFLFDKTLILNWDDIRQVLHGGNNSNLEIALNDDTVHTFRFQLPQAQPERVWLLLVTLHNDALLGRNQQQQPSGRSPESRSSPNSRNG